MSEVRKFHLHDGCTANPKIVRISGLPPAYAETVVLIDEKDHNAKVAALEAEIKELTDLLSQHEAAHYDRQNGG